MPARLTPEDLAFIVAEEGLEYAIRDSVNPDEIADPVIAGLWRVARTAMDQIEEVLPEVDGDDDLYDDDMEDDDDDMDDEDDDDATHEDF